MRVSAARVLRGLGSSTRVSAAPVARVSSNQPCALHGSTVPSVRSRTWHVQNPARTASARLKSTSKSEEHSTSLDADAAHERALAAARAVQQTMASTPGKAFEVTEVDRAKSQILRFLNYKPRTKSELMTKLVDDKLYDPEIATSAIAYLEDKKIISDVDYAEQWARYKWRAAKWAPRRIRTSLLEKGVGDADADEGLRRVFDQLGDVRVTDENRGDAVRDAAPSDARADVIAGEEEDKGAELLRAARKRWVLSVGMDSVKRRRRLVAWLERRGHGMRTASSIMTALEQEDRHRKWAEEAEDAYSENSSHRNDETRETRST
jgi:SOS response regulatory protein OraA/RecX